MLASGSCRLGADLVQAAWEAHAALPTAGLKALGGGIFRQGQQGSWLPAGPWPAFFLEPFLPHGQVELRSEVGTEEEGRVSGRVAPAVGLILSLGTSKGDPRTL